MILRAIQTFIKDPEPVNAADQVVPGLNVIEGIVRTTQPIRSPIRGVSCVAFFYRSFLHIPSGRGGSPPSMHKIKETAGYAPFTLEMAGGSVQVIPAKPGNFTQRDHQNLQSQYGQNFQGVEETVTPGAKVRVRGKVKLQNGVKTLTLKEIVLIDKQGASVDMSSDRKKRKKGKK